MPSSRVLPARRTRPTKTGGWQAAARRQARWVPLCTCTVDEVHHERAVLGEAHAHASVLPPPHARLGGGLDGGVGIARVGRARVTRARHSASDERGGQRHREADGAVGGRRDDEARRAAAARSARPRPRAARARRRARGLVPRAQSSR